MSGHHPKCGLPSKRCQRSCTGSPCYLGPGWHVLPKPEVPCYSTHLVVSCSISSVSRSPFFLYSNTANSPQICTHIPTPPPRSYCIFQSFSLLLLLKSQQPVSINYFLPSSQLPTIRITCSPCSKRCSLEVTEVLSSLRSRTFQLFWFSFSCFDATTVSSLELLSILWQQKKQVVQSF